jgi:hypothetical protein
MTSADLCTYYKSYISYFVQNSVESSMAVVEQGGERENVCVCDRVERDRTILRLVWRVIRE